MNLTAPELSGIELHAIVTELQPLIGAKIDQVYQADAKELILQLHISGSGKRLVRIVAGRLLYETSHRANTKASEFCLQLRRRIASATITGIGQLGAQRIVTFTLQKEHPVDLILELFSKGNIILCSADRTIALLLERQHWQSRELRIGVRYAPPPDVAGIFTLQQGEFMTLLAASEKDKLVTALATGFGLGGLYAEELCTRAAVGKDTSPKALTERQREAVGRAFVSLLGELRAPRGYLWQSGIITPVPVTRQALQREFATFHEALDALISTTKARQQQLAVEQRYQQKIQQLRTIIEKQQHALAALEARAAEETRKADALYENYQQVKGLLEKVEHTHAKGGWDAVRGLLARDKAITAVDLKNKKVELELG